MSVFLRQFAEKWGPETQRIVLDHFDKSLAVSVTEGSVSNSASIVEFILNESARWKLMNDTWTLNSIFAVSSNSRYDQVFQVALDILLERVKRNTVNACQSCYFGTELIGGVGCVSEGDT
jgi:hypothetical protein